MDEAPRRRRSLTHIGGPTDTEGEPAAARLLAYALAVPPSTGEDDDPARSHVHGFHTYPARLHPATASRLAAAFVPPGGRVLDPFCGSGTVLVEAMIRGRYALGTDLNPLAVRLARCKTRPRNATQRTHLVDRAAAVAAGADARRKARTGATRRLPEADVALFEPHVLLELDSLRAEIQKLDRDPARPDLELILSSILVKLSRKKADTSSALKDRRTAAGFAARLFFQRAEDLAARQTEFAQLLPSPLPPPAFVTQDDATVLRTVPGAVDAVITSPPYAGTYDYLGHHLLRLRWLGLDPGPLARGEVGARWRYRSLGPAEARQQWDAELRGFLRAAARVLLPGGCVVLVLADSEANGHALRADEIAAEAARACGLVPTARASQARPHFHGPMLAAFRERPRAEHALLFRRAGSLAGCCRCP